MESYVEFHYLPDLSPLGLLTLPPHNFRYIRGSKFVGDLSRCMHDGFMGWGEKIQLVLSHTIELLESGLSSLNDTVSSLFDFDWRTCVERIHKACHPRVLTKGQYRQISCLIPENKVILIEGLIVDMVNGGIGLRNHSAPQWQPRGSSWTEDVTFLQSESYCVDTKLTLNFSAPANEDIRYRCVRYSLVDRGGFTDIESTLWPEVHRAQAHKFPTIKQRAYTSFFQQFPI